MTHHNGEWLKSVTSELDSAGIAYSVRHGSKHLLIDYEVDGIKKVATVGKGTRVNWRNVRNARADVKRAIREVRDRDLSGEFKMSNLPKITHESFEVVDGKPRMRDLDIAAALGFSRPDNVRNLIKSNIDEIKSYGEIIVSNKSATERGGRPSQVYLLNHDQSILISIMSRTPEASNVRRQVIEAYGQWKSIHKKPQQEMKAIPSASVEPEVLMNGQAISAITEAVCSKIAARDGSTPEFQNKLIDHLSQMFDWQRAQFEQLHDKMSGSNGVELIGSIPSLDDLDMKNSLQEQINTAISSLKGPIEEITMRLNQLGSTASIETVMPVTIDVAPNVEAPRQVIEIESEIELVDMPNLYRMMGLTRRVVPNRQALSQSMRISLEKFAKRRGVEPIEVTKYGIKRNNWPKSMVESWVNSKGNDIVAAYVGKKMLNSGKRFKFKSPVA